MRGMSTALSGLKAAQAGLSVIGHNVSNSSTTGYTRQLLVQSDYNYLNGGSSATGSGVMQIGLGTQNSQIRQIRNKFYDVNFRDENSAGSYFARKYTAGEEINTIIGELQSEYKAQDTINDIWNSVNELVQDPSAIETRSSFIQTCVTFLDKMKDINRNLFEYQMNLNEQVKNEVDKINDIVSSIKDVNMKIQEIEVGGKKANDLQDMRNNLIDELSGILDITVKEKSIPGSSAVMVDIYVSGQELLADNVQNTLGLQYTSGDYPFYEPVFTSSKEILPFGTTDSKLFPSLSSKTIGSDLNTERGSLKGLLISRGGIMANFTTDDAEIDNFLIPKVQKKIDSLVHEVVTMLNNSVVGNKDLNGKDGIPIFVRTGIANDGGYDANGNPIPLAPEDINGNSNTWYTIENIAINPELLEPDGYNKLAFSSTGDKGDTSILSKLSKDWKEARTSLDGSSIDSYYKQIITDFAVEIKTDRQKLEARLGTIDLAENKRFSMSGVSLDEELSNMLKYQHAYNSAAKIINVLDSMLDKIINGTGRVGA